MRGKILLFGTTFLSFHQRVRELGFEPILFNDVPVGDFDGEFILLSLANLPNLPVETFAKYTQKHICGVISCREPYAELASQVRSTFFPYLPGLSFEKMKIIRDKLQLKNLLVKMNIATTDFLELDATSTWKSVSEKLGSDILLKPRKGWLAQGVRHVKSVTEWDQAFQEGVNSETFYAEKFETNIREYCCDTVVARKKIVCQFPGEYTVDCLTSNYEQKGIGVNFPGFCTEEEIEELRDISRRFVTEFEIDDGYCHIEFFRKNNRWIFGEIGVRTPGGYQLPTETEVAGIDLQEVYLKMHLKDEVNFPQIDTRNRYFGYYLYPKRVGKLKTVKYQFDHSWIVKHAIYVRDGQDIAKEDTSTSTAAAIIYRANSLADLKTFSDSAPGLCQLEME